MKMPFLDFVKWFCILHLLIDGVGRMWVMMYGECNEWGLSELYSRHGGLEYFSFGCTHEFMVMLFN